MYVFFTTLAVLLLAGAVVLMAVLYLRLKYEQDNASRQDLANAMILFQSMRDLLEEQKQLARAFNDSIDRKITFIREAMGAPAVDRAPERSDAPAPPEDQTDDVPETPPAPEADAASGTLHILADPEPHAASDDLIDAWDGLDLGRRTRQEPPVNEPAHEPVTPEEAEEARDAVRSLLDMPGNGHDDLLVRMPSSGNGSDAMAPALHSRVYEYHDAGMSVPQIAHELGIGKGEVRLMISLRKDREG